MSAITTVAPTPAKPREKAAPNPDAPSCHDGDSAVEPKELVQQIHCLSYASSVFLRSRGA